MPGERTASHRRSPPLSTSLFPSAPPRPWPSRTAPRHSPFPVPDYHDNSPSCNIARRLALSSPVRQQQRYNVDVGERRLRARAPLSNNLHPRGAARHPALDTDLLRKSRHLLVASYRSRVLVLS